jgi:hypothetical protein
MSTIDDMDKGEERHLCKGPDEAVNKAEAMHSHTRWREDGEEEEENDDHRHLTPIKLG